MKVIQLTPVDKVHDGLPVVTVVPHWHTRPTMAVLPENLWRWQMSVKCVSDVHRVKRKGEKTVPWGKPVLQITTPDTQSRSLTNWVLSVR